MGVRFRTIYPLTKEDKKAILRDVLPERTEDREIFRRMDEQNMAIKDIQKKLDVLMTVLPGMSVSQNKHPARDKLVQPDSSLNSPKYHNKSKKAFDRSKFEPLVDGEKEVKEISDSWEEIFASIDDGTYRTKYKIGNYKPLDLGSEGIVRMQIAGFDVEPLAKGNGRAAVTWIAMDLLKTKKRINPELKRVSFKKEYVLSTGTAGGWKDSEIRKYMANDIKKHIPYDVCIHIKYVKKYSFSADNCLSTIENEETIDELWIPSMQEVCGGFVEESKSQCYKSLFNNDSDRSKESSWWSRTIFGTEFGTDSFFAVTKRGRCNIDYVTNEGSILLGFCT